MMRQSPLPHAQLHRYWSLKRILQPLVFLGLGVLLLASLTVLTVRASAVQPEIAVRSQAGSPDVIATQIAGYVWADADADGVFDATEAGLAGVTVDVHHGQCQTFLPPAATTTSTRESGKFTFIGLADGDYCLVVQPFTLPPDLINTTRGDKLDVTLTGSAPSLGNNFGYAPVFATDRLTVNLAQCTDITWLQQKTLSYGGVIAAENRERCLFLIDVPPDQQAALATDLQDEPDVLAAGPDVRTSAAFTPNDPDYNNPSFVYGPLQIHAESAWDYTTGDPDLIVAVIDSGADLAHPEWGNRIIAGHDYVNDDDDPADDNGHGTHVAGIIAAGIDNGIGIAGMTGSSRLLVIKALDANKMGWWSDVALAIIDAVDQGARVINLSLTGTTDSQLLRNAVQYAGANDVLVVVAAGNSGTDQLQYPASYADVLAVGATTFSGTRWSLSNFGPNLDVLAPGATVYSTYWRAGAANAYAFLSGTSMAAPHAAGLAALLLSMDPALTRSQLIQIITATAFDMGDPGPDALHGFGRIDAGAAAAAVAALLPTATATSTALPPPTSTPTPTPTHTPSPTPTPTPTATPTSEPSATATPTATATATPRPIVIQGYLWNDTDGNGIQNEGPAAGFADVTVSLYWDDGDGIFESAALSRQSAAAATAAGLRPSADTLISLRDTEADGGFRFSVPAGGVVWLQVDESAPALVGLSPLPDTPNPNLLTISATDTPLAVFAFAGTGAIAGIVYYDWNRNQEQDIGETGIADVEVCLYKDAFVIGVLDETDTLLDCMLTNAAGFYQFAGYAPGTYLVVETQLPGFQNTTPNVIGIALVVTGNSGESAGNDFGDTAYGSVSGMTFIDSNGNGDQDPGETAGVPNVPITLTNPSSGLILQQSSGITGTFAFTDLLPAYYRLTVDANIGGLTPTTPSVREFVLGPAENYTDVNAGFIAPTAVQIVHFSAIRTDERVEVLWRTQSETDVSAFQVRRADDLTGPYKIVSPPIAAQGGASGSYHWQDTTARAGEQLWYQLESLPGSHLFGPVPVRDAPGLGGNNSLYIPFVTR